MDTSIINKYLKEMRDEDNPEFLYSLTSTKLLLLIGNKRFDPILAAKKELINRGVDKSGKWIGHEKAAQLWK